MPTNRVVTIEETYRELRRSRPPYPGKKEQTTFYPAAVRERAGDERLLSRRKRLEGGEKI